MIDAVIPEIRAKMVFYARKTLVIAIQFNAELSDSNRNRFLKTIATRMHYESIIKALNYSEVRCIFFALVFV